MNTRVGSDVLEICTTRFVVMKALLLLFSVLVIASRPAVTAAESENSPRTTKRSSSQITEALTEFQLKPGFRIELVASEPMVVAPVAMAFDENGRLFVVEMPDYPDRGEQLPHLGRVRVLEQPDEDGVFQTSTTYADNLRLPSAVACYAGGVFVAATPDIYFFKASQGGGGADVNQVVLTGFGATNTPNPNALLNSFAWGLDNRIHGVTAGIGGTVTAPTWSSGSVSMEGSDFSFDPRTLAVFREAGTAQSGLSFDSRGRKLVSDFNRPLRQSMYELRYTARNPFYARPSALVNVGHPATHVFGFASTNLANTPTSDSTHSSTVLVPHWLSSARGFVIYRGSAFPTNYHENVFIPDFEGHAIHRAVLRENGLEMTAERPADERNTEFLISKDTAFRPAQVISGPDGALYIADMRAGNEQGRIYRVVPEKFKRPKPPELGKAKILDLVSVLAQSDSWHQDTAARLLYERQDAAAIPLLTNMLNNSQLPLVRLQALRALDGVGGLREAHLLRALRDTDPRVREFAIRLTEKLVRDGGISEALWAYLKPLAIDPSLRVRYQMAFTLGEIARPEKAMLLAQILSRDLNNPWIQNAVFSSSSEGAGNLFAVLAGNARFRNDAAGLEFLRQLALEIGVSGRMQDVTQTVGLLAESALDRYQSFVLLGALGEGLRRTRSSLPLVDTQNGLQKFYLSAFEAAIDVSVPERVRVEAVRLLGVSPYTFAEIHDWLLLVCNPPPAPALQSAAVATLCRYDDPLLVRGLFERWRGFGPVVRHNAVDSLLGRSSYVPTVWTAAQSGRISLADLTPTQLNFIRTYREPSISQEATRRFGAVAVKRPQIVDRFKPALKLRGASERGREIFRLRCAECHVVGGQEERLGPNLAGVRVGGKEKVFMSIVEPHANVAPEYATSIVETRDGGNVLGIKIAETPTTITLRLPGNTESVWPKLNVQAVHRQTWSLMPDGLEQNFSVQDMADLLDFLMTAR